MTLLIAINDKCITVQLPRRTLRASISALKEEFNIKTTNSEDWSFYTPSTNLDLSNYKASRKNGTLKLTSVDSDTSLKSLFKVNPSTSLVSLIVQPPGMSVTTSVYISLTCRLETSLTVSVNNVVVTIKVDVSLTIHGLIKELKKTEEGCAIKTCDRYHIRKPKYPIWTKNFDKDKSSLETEVITDNMRLTDVFELFPHENIVSLIVETEGSGEFSSNVCMVASN